MRYEYNTFAGAIIVLMIFIGLMAFLEAIPNWVMRKNFYANPWYALGGFVAGVLLGILFGLMIEKLYRLWSSDI